MRDALLATTVSVAGVTEIPGEMSLALLGFETSDAVMVCVPTVFNVTGNVTVPETSDVLAGNNAMPSLDDKPTSSVPVFTKFQKASTAFTVTLKVVPET